MESGLPLCTYSETQMPWYKHFHNVYELIYVTSGAVRFQIGKSSYLGKEGTAVFISKLEEHSTEILEEPYRRYFIQLTPSQLEAFVPEPKLRSVFISRPDCFQHAFELGSVRKQAEQLMQALFQEAHHPLGFGENAVSSLLELFLILCHRACGNQFSLPDKSFPEVVAHVQKYIDLHFFEPLTVEQLAAKFYVSSSYLSHIFHEWTGYSPKQYMMLSRLSYAKKLLSETAKPVLAIAVKCGFRDVNNFIRTFRQQYGLTPAAYRKRK